MAQASPQFGAMLRHIDAVADTLGLCGYGVSLSSMEEVFLELARTAKAPIGVEPATSLLASSYSATADCTASDAPLLGSNFRPPPHGRWPMTVAPARCHSAFFKRSRC